MFSSFVAQVQRTLVICWLAVMPFVVSLPANSSLLLRRRDKPRPLPDKMTRPRNLTPAVCGICSICIPGNDGSRPNGRKQREDLLSSLRIRGREWLQFTLRDLRDDPHPGEMCPRSLQAGPDVTYLRSWWNPHGVKLLRNDPMLIGLIACHII